MTVDANPEWPAPRARELSAADRTGLPTAVAGAAAGLAGGGVLATGVVLAAQGHGEVGVIVIIAAALVIALVSVVSAGLAIIAPGREHVDEETNMSLGASA
jgi:hypothetical protein